MPSWKHKPPHVTRSSCAPESRVELEAQDGILRPQTAASGQNRVPIKPDVAGTERPKTAAADFGRTMQRNNTVPPIEEVPVDDGRGFRVAWASQPENFNLQSQPSQDDGDQKEISLPHRQLFATLSQEQRH